MNKYFKIGITQSHPYKRLEGLQVGNPIKLEMLWAIETKGYKLFERVIHNKLKGYHKSGCCYG